MLDNVDFVHTDLVLTADGVLVCFHDIHLGRWTDVADRPEFSDKIAPSITLNLEGQEHEIKNDWLITNFTLEEVRSLKVRQEDVGLRSQSFNDLFRIPTFHEFLETINRDTFRRTDNGTRKESVVGIIVTIKYPYYQNEIVFQKRHFIEQKFLEEMEYFGYIENECQHRGVRIPCNRIVAQSSNVTTINYLSKTSHFDLMMALDTSNWRYLTYKGLPELKGIATHIALWKELIVTGTEAQLLYEKKSWNKDQVEALGGFVGPHQLVEYIHGLGMKAAVYTVYSSHEPSLRGCAVICVNETKEQELEFLFDSGVDTIFVEGLDESMRIRDHYFKHEGNATAVWKQNTHKDQDGFIKMVANLFQQMMKTVNNN